MLPRVKVGDTKQHMYRVWIRLTAWGSPLLPGIIRINLKLNSITYRAKICQRETLRLGSRLQWPGKVNTANVEPKHLNFWVNKVAWGDNMTGNSLMTEQIIRIIKRSSWEALSKMSKIPEIVPKRWRRAPLPWEAIYHSHRRTSLILLADYKICHRSYRHQLRCSRRSRMLSIFATWRILRPSRP